MKKTRVYLATLSVCIVYALTSYALAESTSPAQQFFGITVLDSAGSPISCVKFTTVNNIVYLTNDHGQVVIYEPGLMGEKVWFDIERDGYASMNKTFVLNEGETGELYMVSNGEASACSVGTDDSDLLDDLSVPTAEKYFLIQVIDETTGRPVPLISLTSPTNNTYWTDSNGLIAFYEPDMNDGEDVFFTVEGPGYELSDPFQFGGVWLRTETGNHESATQVLVNPVANQIAQRLYRITGGGIYRDSVLTGQETPIDEPLINGMVVGQDSTYATIYRGDIFWAWGDTDKPSHRLGNFKVTAATSKLPEQGGLDSQLGVNLSYYIRGDGSGFVKEMASHGSVPVPDGDPTSLPTVWVDSLVSVPDDNGIERLYAT